MMSENSLRSVSGKAAKGVLLVTTTVWSSVALMSVTEDHQGAFCPAGLLYCMKSSTTLAAVTGAPDWNLRPLRSLKVQTDLSALVVQDSARFGTTFPVGSSISSGSLSGTWVGSIQAA